MENTVSASSSALNISFLHGPVLTDILLNVVIVGTIGVGVHNGTVDVNVVDQGRGCLVTSAQKVNPELDTVPGWLNFGFSWFEIETPVVFSTVGRGWHS